MGDEFYKIKSMKEFNKKGMGEKIGYNLHSAWYFETWYDKLILVGLGVLAMWKIVGFF